MSGLTAYHVPASLVEDLGLPKPENVFRHKGECMYHISEIILQVTPLLVCQRRLVRTSVFVRSLLFSNFLLLENSPLRCTPTARGRGR
jgi:hypothetical protein